MREARQREREERARHLLSVLLENAEVAAEEKRPICQDTGIPVFWVEVGEDFLRKWGWELIEQAIRESIAEATEAGLLRPNTVDPLSRRNFGNNLGIGHPIIYPTISRGEEVVVKLALRGAGCENITSLEMPPPTAPRQSIFRVVLEAVFEAGGKPCPPVVIGVGVGGVSETALALAKKALLREIGAHHQEAEIASLERKLLEAVNKLGLGPMGLGGRTTALWVGVEHAACHTASLPIAVCVSCWALRRSEGRLLPNGSFEVW